MDTEDLGRHPIVRGVAMNSVDHPHGGGERRTKGNEIRPHLEGPSWISGWSGERQKWVHATTIYMEGKGSFFLMLRKSFFILFSNSGWVWASGASFEDGRKKTGFGALRLSPSGSGGPLPSFLEEHEVTSSWKHTVQWPIIWSQDNLFNRLSWTSQKLSLIAILNFCVIRKLMLYHVISASGTWKRQSLMIISVIIPSQISSETSIAILLDCSVLSCFFILRIFSYGFLASPVTPK